MANIDPELEKMFPKSGAPDMDAALEAQFPVTDLRITPRGQRIIGAIPEFLQGVGRGATFGLTNYPAAALMMATRAMGGAGGPENTYAANLAEIESRNIEMAKRPGYTLGELAGGILGGGTLGVGKTMLGTIGRGAGIGAVSGLTTESGQPKSVAERLLQAEYGAALGAGLGAISGAAVPLARGAETFVRNQYRNNQLGFINNSINQALAREPDLINKARSQLIANVNASKPNLPAAKALKQQKIQIDSINNASDDQILNMIGTAATKPGIPGLQIDPGVYRDLAAVRGAKTKMAKVDQMPSEEMYDYVLKNLKYAEGKKIQSAMDITKAAIPGMSLGALAGSGAALMQGTPQNIPAYAAMGAGLGGAYKVRDALLAAGQAGMTTGLAKYPLAGPREIGVVGRMTGLPTQYNMPAMITAGGLTGSATLMDVPTEQRPPFASQSSIDRLTDLANEFKLRTQGNQ
jgi:hypothetical protein